MATLTSLGVGSGLDLNTMVTQLVALERRPLSAMQSRATELQTQVSALGRMQSLLSSLQDASNALTNNTLWSQGVAASSDATTVAAVGGAGATAGSYAVTVESLAASQTLSSSTVFSGATALVGAGTLQFTLGTWDATQSAFTDKSGATPVTVTATATDTLQSLRDKINASGAGVTATLVTDATGVRLALRSTTSGAANGFKVTAGDDDGNHTDNAGLSRLAYDPTAGAAGMLHKQAATNAKATVNGIAVESATNELSSVVDGLTLTLNRMTAPAAPVTVTVNPDRDNVKKAITAFADAYNALASYIADQTKYDPNSKVAGTLQGDSAVGSLMSQMRAVLNTPTGASSMFSRLSNVGLQLQRDGTLKVDTTLLTNASTNLAELKKAFANSDSVTPANEGFARRYAALATKALGIGGVLTTRSEGLRKLITKNSDDQERLNDRVDRFEARLIAQYTAMDSNLARLNALSSYVTQQIAQMNKSTDS